MSRKHRPALSRPAPAGTPVSPEAHARQVLDAGRYREAIELYKNLLKQERRSEWLDGLAASYAGRAKELASKSMLQEALVIWRNRSTLCGKSLVEGPYLDWLLRTGAHDAALRLLTPTGDAVATVDADLETRLAAVALTAPDSALAQLAADSPLRRHRAAAQAAIAACCRGDLADLDEQLRCIPFRSPYRDLRFILKALLLVGNDAAQAAGLIARVTVDGPFEKLAAVVRAGVLPGKGWLLALLDLDEEGRYLLLEIKGCPENRRPLLLEVAALARNGVPPTPTGVVDLLLRRSRGLPATAARLCRRLLPYAEKRLAEYRNAFGPLGEAESERILALAAQCRGAINHSESHWLHAVRLFSTEEAPLQAALILRHLFDLIVGDKDASDYDDECTSWLERSLELDPDDRATHLKLIRLHRQGRNMKAARASVETALARFANDPAVLLEAVETALAGNAFKKAVTLAKRLLDLDPINSKVRALIGRAHLSHARKQIRLHRPEAAGKELDLADVWLATANERSVSKLLRGLSADDARATVLLREAVGELGGRLLAAWHVLLESIRVGSQPAGELRRAAPDLSGMPMPREVLTVMHAINALGDNESKALRTVLDTLRAPLKRAAAGEFSESERISICETLLRREERALLQAYADAGLRRWPERPLFVYLATFAKHGQGAFFAMSERERQALEGALKKALEDGDQRTVLRIRDLMGPPGYFSGEDSDDFDDDDDFGDLVDDLPANPREVFNLLMSMGGPNEVIRMAREILPDSKFRPLEHAAGGNRKKLAEMLIELLAESLANLDLPSFTASPSGGLPEPKPRSRSTAPKQPVQDDRQKGLFDD
ncbi:MAG: hypothetical protein HWD57_21130 [Candidatus Accumulibacter cognatus]|uniref:Tetratricopeptide repeat protein n=1 Tax=Candidatus Accumulibacter cognatus TaxID=2954383 RepID=A0A7D5SHJ0_9PROT|nr:MAG: hypothetical protein HWD57_21130 [Candidatus Accumulibacter cognatus]